MSDLNQSHLQVELVLDVLLEMARETRRVREKTGVTVL